MKKKAAWAFVITACIIAYLTLTFGNRPGSGVGSIYPIHRNITATVFHPGEAGNSMSAWDKNWADKISSGNKFYAALPYNDLDRNGARKKDAFRRIYWAGNKDRTGTVSICKNRWIKIMKNGTVCFARWEDVGPFNTDDAKYVFGTRRPDSKRAGLDVSPEVRGFLGMHDTDTVDWQFVEDADVPDGPWLE